MALAAADLLEPSGEIAAALFPDDTAPPATGAGSLLARLTAYLEDATRVIAAGTVVSGGDEDEAARQWAYYRAWRAVHTAMSATAATVTAGGATPVTRSFLGTQIQNFQTKADGALAAFRALVPDPVTTASTTAAAARPAPASSSVALTVAW